MLWNAHTQQSKQKFMATEIEIGSYMRIGAIVVSPNACKVENQVLQASLRKLYYKMDL